MHKLLRQQRNYHQYTEIINSSMHFITVLFKKCFLNSILCFRRNSAMTAKWLIYLHPHTLYPEIFVGQKRQRLYKACLHHLFLQLCISSKQMVKDGQKLAHEPKFVPNQAGLSKADLCPPQTNPLQCKQPVKVFVEVHAKKQTLETFKSFKFTSAMCCHCRIQCRRHLNASQVGMCDSSHQDEW